MVWEPLYQMTTKPFAWEDQLIKSKTFRRLKYISHYGASALATPLTHSRYEHSLGVWSITANFFPENIYLRLAALLHDIGHLPFSHSLEKELGLSHHKITEEKILRGEVAVILNKHNLEPGKVVAILNLDSPLSNSSNLLAIDHLDSFLRDTYMWGKFSKQPSDILKAISFNGIYIETDESNAVAITEAIVNDHQLFLSPRCLAVDKLLSTAVYMYCMELGDKEFICDLVDFQLLNLLEKSSIPEVKETIEVLLYQPHRIEFSKQKTNGSIEVGVRKIYGKSPLVNGNIYLEINQEAKRKIETLENLKRTYYVWIK